MNQHIGAILDKVFFIGAGLFCLLVSPKFIDKDPSSEEAKKRLKTIRRCGFWLIICGIASFIVMLFRK